MSNEEIVEIGEISQDSKNMTLLMWIGTFFFGFIPGLILFLWKKEDGYIQAQSKEALNWSITSLIASVIASILTIIVIGVILFPIIGLCHLVFCIMGALATSKGDQFSVPFAIRLLK